MHTAMPRSLIAASLSMSLAAPTAGCATRGGPTVQPTPPSYADATSQDKCGVRRSGDRPLVVEWPAADRAALEARAQNGLVAVRYEGCDMEVLTGCTVHGEYDFVSLSRKQERVSIHNADELYARLPVGAAALEGKLERSGQLVVDMTIIGRKQADRHVVSRRELSGRCDGATHVLTGLTVGAFSLYAGAAIEAGASVAVGQAGAGAGTRRAREILASDGDLEHCDVAHAEEPNGCAALLRVEAVPLTGTAADMFPQHEMPTAHEVAAEDQQRRRFARRRAAWQGTSIASGVLAAGSVGGMIGGAVMLAQYNDDTFGIDVVPTPEQAAKRKKGTQLLVGSSIGFLGFTALSIGAATAARRVHRERLTRVTPVASPQFAGLSLSGRF